MAAAVGLACLAVLTLHARSYLPFIADDALISLRYARRLLDGHGLTWTAGERVEGYSNLLWVLLCAGLGRMGIDLIVAARALGLACCAAALLAIVGAPRDSPAAAWPAAAGGLAFALCGPVAVWAIGGLEQPLVAALLGFALVLLLPAAAGSAAATPARTLAAAIALALLCLSRPDGILFTAAACAGLLAARGAGRAALLACVRLAALPALAWLAQLAFRLAYYGDWFPNSAYAKLGFTLQRLHGGSLYLAGGVPWLAALLLPALLLAPAVRGDPRASRRVRFLLAPLVIWGGYVILIGGDIFPARRHWVPLVVILALLLVEGLRGVERRGGSLRTAARVAVPLWLVALGVAQQLDPENRRAHDERWEWDGAAIGGLLRTAFADRHPLLAVDPAGTLPYFSGLDSIDLLGINDRHMARNRPPDFGQGYLGHELGDGAYVLDREPDLVLFCAPRGRARPCFRSGSEMVADPRFRLRYRLVQLEAGGDEPLRSRIWIRAEGGRLGIERGETQVSVPGYFLMANRASAARLDADGRLVTPVDAGTPAGLAGLALGPGSWRMRIDHAGPAPEVQVRGSGSGPVLARGGDELSFTLVDGGPATIDLRVVAAGGPTRLRGVAFERTDAPGRAQ